MQVKVTFLQTDEPECIFPKASRTYVENPFFCIDFEDHDNSLRTFKIPLVSIKWVNEGKTSQ